MKGFSIKIIKTIKLMFFLMMLMWLSGFIREYQLYTSHQLIVGNSGYSIDQIDRNKRPFVNVAISEAPHLVFLVIPNESLDYRLRFGYERGFPASKTLYVAKSCVNKVFWDNQYILSYYVDGAGKEWAPYYITTVYMWKYPKHGQVKPSDCFSTVAYDDRDSFNHALDSLHLETAQMDSLFYTINHEEIEDDCIYDTKETWRRYAG